MTIYQQLYQPAQKLEKFKRLWLSNCPGSFSSPINRLNIGRSSFLSNFLRNLVCQQIQENTCASVFYFNATMGINWITIEEGGPKKMKWWCHFKSWKNLKRRKYE